MLERFEPAQYSLQDLHFLLEHLGKSPIIAFRQPLPEGTHKNRLDEVLRTVYEHSEIAAAEDGYTWCGIPPLADSISRFLLWHDLSAEILRRKTRDANGSLITHPSMYSWDEDGRAFKFAVDADSGEMVRTEIASDGSRRPFGVTFANRAGETMPHISDIAPWVKASPGERAHRDDKIVDEKTATKGTSNLRCTICDYTQQYDTRDPGKRRMAMVRMHKHLKTAKVSVNRHRVLLTRVGR